MKSLAMLTVLMAAIALSVSEVLAQEQCPQRVWVSCNYAPALPAAVKSFATLRLTGAALTAINHVCNGVERGYTVLGDLTAILRVPKVVDSLAVGDAKLLTSSAYPVSVKVTDIAGNVMTQFTTTKAPLNTGIAADFFDWTGPPICAQLENARIEAYTSADSCIKKTAGTTSLVKLHVNALDKSDNTYLKTPAEFPGLRFGYTGTYATTSKPVVASSLQFFVGYVRSVAVQVDLGADNVYCSCYKYNMTGTTQPILCIRPELVTVAVDHPTSRTFYSVVDVVNDVVQDVGGAAKSDFLMNRGGVMTVLGASSPGVKASSAKVEDSVPLGFIL